MIFSPSHTVASDSLCLSSEKFAGLYYLGDLQERENWKVIRECLNTQSCTTGFLNLLVLGFLLLYFCSSLLQEISDCAASNTTLEEGRILHHIRWCKDLWQESLDQFHLRVSILFNIWLQ
jgi:hypothetical protein